VLTAAILRQPGALPAAAVRAINPAMKFGRLSHTLLALCFLAAQMVAVVHATEHELKPERSAACQICSLAHAAGAAPVAAIPTGLILPHDRERAPLTVAAVELRPIARPNSRGPPLILV
jgi:hypothetical protein